MRERKRRRTVPAARVNPALLQEKTWCPKCLWSLFLWAPTEQGANISQASTRKITCFQLYSDSGCGDFGVTLSLSLC